MESNASNPPKLGVIDSLNDAPISFFHLRAAFTAGMGFFTDAYDLFIIGSALVYIKPEWHLGDTQIAFLGSISLVAAFLGAFIFGRLADVVGRKRIYGMEALLMVIGGLACAFAPSFLWLLVFRVILGIGIGGDYPMSAVLMAEYANAKKRGALTSLVFGMQGLGLAFGPVVALTLEASGLPPDSIWRIMLGIGALPPLAVLYLRRTMPESPRYKALVRGDIDEAAKDMATYSSGQVTSKVEKKFKPSRISLGQMLSNPKYLILILGTGGAWFLNDYAFYGNAISTPEILKLVAPNSSNITGSAWALMIFAIFAIPGYLASIFFMDAVGHKRLQMIGFGVMAAAFAAIALVPGITDEVVPFLLLYGVSFFFIEFGPNCTTFVMPAEVFPTSIRTTGHGMAAGIGKFGAFVGTFVFPYISAAGGVKGAMLFSAGVSVLGVILTKLTLPEPSGKTLEEIGGEHHALSSDAVVLPTASV
ncbi:MFS transporter [Candidatus Igneacidithiobacillus taiwanensis]|uniref:MFS transporter n=3 Tax=Candidatus Igneacidithiobacillus taiwanensis TaxID=1945924 RepID=UPI00289AFC9B|nr:MFS transporter [Candidatus Igneacidithiobacillus taiwanensis]MCE5361511.1 MFS transporter [Acidithiobacillus sp.]